MGVYLEWHICLDLAIRNMLHYSQNQSQQQSELEFRRNSEGLQRVPETESGGRIHTSTITVAVIIVTGVLGNVIGEQICKIFRIQEPVAVGLALGTSAHAIGTTKALELGEVQGAMSSLSIAVAGLMTVVGSLIFYHLY